VTKLFLLVLLVLSFQVNACSYHSDDKWIEEGGPTKNTNLVLFFKKDTTHEQIEAFKDTVLSKPSPYGPNTGHDLPDGVASDFRLLNCSYEGVGVNFSTDATPEQKEQLKKAIRESPIIYKIYENVVPSEIKDLCLQTTPPDHSDEKWVRMSGPNDPASLVFFFKKGTSYEQREAFDKTVLSYPHPEGKGYNLQDGIASTLYVLNSGYEGYAIQFSTGATPEQREQLRRNIQESPIVYKVYENVVPSQIKDL
jgi:hypothetical protein